MKGGEGGVGGVGVSPDDVMGRVPREESSD